MKQLVVIAEEQERKLAEQYFPGIPVKITGVGAINIINSLRDIPSNTEIYNIGYAGSANFDLGTWVEVTESRLNHPNVTYPEPELKLSIINHQSLIKQAPCYTNCDFVLASDYKDCVFDMELAFIAALGFKTVHSIKYVSDNLSLHAYHDLTHGVE